MFRRLHQNYNYNIHNLQHVKRFIPLKDRQEDSFYKVFTMLKCMKIKGSFKLILFCFTRFN